MAKIKTLRENDYSPEEREAIVKHVCNEIAKKRSLYKIIAEDDGMPGYSTFMEWQRQSESIADRVARAREDALEAIIEEIIEIADDSGHDAYIWTDPKTGRHYARIDGDCVQRAKLKIHARERAAQMLAPRRFGVQRMDVTSDGKALPASETNVTMIENRVASILMLAQQRAKDERAIQQLMD